jgi:hypothetical protein
MYNKNYIAIKREENRAKQRKEESKYNHVVHNWLKYLFSKRKIGSAASHSECQITGTKSISKFTHLNSQHQQCLSSHLLPRTKSDSRRLARYSQQFDLDSSWYTVQTVAVAS